MCTSDEARQGFECNAPRVSKTYQAARFHHQVRLAVLHVPLQLFDQVFNLALLQLAPLEKRRRLVLRGAVRKAAPCEPLGVADMATRTMGAHAR